MSRTENTRRSIAWGMLQKVLGILLPFATRTVLIRTMGMEYVGLGSLFSSLLQVLSFAELGIGSAMVFSMYEPMAKNDTPRICALLNLYRKCYLIIGIIIVTLAAVMLPLLPYLIEGDVPTDINIYILFGIYVLNNAAGYFLFTYKQSLFIADQRVDIINKITLVFNVISNLLQIILLLSVKNYYAYILILPAITCVTNFTFAILTKRMYPNYICKGRAEKEELQSIKKRLAVLCFRK